MLLVFRLQKTGNIEEQMMYNTFNMGVGMVLAVDSADVDKTIAAIAAAGDKAWVLGEAVSGDKGVILCGNFACNWHAFESWNCGFCCYRLFFRSGDDACL